MSYRCIISNLKAGAFVLLIGSALAVSGCKDDPTLFGGCSTQNVNACPTSEGFANPYEGQLELLTWTETLRKASLELTGQLPTEQQIRASEDLGQLGLEASLAELMREPAFGDRIIELYNDHFLTDKYLGRENAIELLDEEIWPNLRWFDSRGEDDDGVALITNDSLAREPLELIAHVIRNERPFTEILTADYAMLNGYSALSLIGLPDLPLGIGEDPERFRAIQVPGIPHAGILTSPMFLNRFPTSDTNINRHRSRMTYWFFLDIDINRFGSRPVDASDDFGENPTLNNPDCAVCHTTMDPIAGLYMNWNERGEYSGQGEWFGPDYILPPGFNGEALPDGERKRALQWLGKRLAENPRFAQATVKTVFEGLTGQKVLDLSVGYVVPDMGGMGGTGGDMGAGGAGGMGIGGAGGMGIGGAGGMGVGGAGGMGIGGAGGMGVGGAGGEMGTGGTMPPPPPPPPLPEIEPEIDPDVDPALERAYDVQQDILRIIQQRFIESNYNFKLLVREIVLSPYFRAANATPLTADMEIELSTFGTARLLTPEHLNRKIEATTGIRWRQRPDRADYLRDQYRIFYGGIDSDLVTQRVTAPNGVMASLAQRMAYEVACSAVPYDFSKASNQRLLFPGIDRNVAIDNGSDQVRDAVRHLHEQLLGESLGANDPEIDATMVVLTEAYSLGRNGLSTGAVSEELADPCRLNNDRMTGDSLPDNRRINQDPDYTLRAWMAAVSYLLSDYRYLYE
ncbi:MAG: hypothetical protein OEM15_08090 [Myxococcales bacterium]|nr:hypothetical protein [Myxococcales bacterium]